MITVHILFTLFLKIMNDNKIIRPIDADLQVPDTSKCIGPSKTAFNDFKMAI